VLKDNFMTDWNEVVDISDLHNAFDIGEKSIAEMAKLVYDRLSGLKCAKDPRFMSIIQELNTIKDEEHYDIVLDSICDYGDNDDILFIKSL